MKRTSSTVTFDFKPPRSLRRTTLRVVTALPSSHDSPSRDCAYHDSESRATITSRATMDSHAKMGSHAKMDRRATLEVAAEPRIFLAWGGVK